MVRSDITIPGALPDFIKLWNFGNPKETEQKFQEILSIAQTANDPSYVAQLLSQIARTQGLQGKFDEAHATLDRVEEMLTSDLQLARIRYLLERGRAFNSSNHQDRSIPLFIDAYTLASSIDEMKLAIDAIHMIAIAESDPKNQVEWNFKGIEMAMSDLNSIGWLHALYNNIGESYLLLKDYENARLYFHKLIELQIQRNGEADIHTLKDEAKAIRFLGKPNEALSILEPLLKKIIDAGMDNGWIREEIAENHLLLGENTIAKPHFIKAFELLSKDEFCIKNEQDKLRYLKKLAE
jgi:tetratricopeptide (TPR) repeat protein